MEQNQEGTAVQREGVRCFDLFGRSSYLTMGEVIGKLKHSYVWLFLFLILSLFVLLDVHEYRLETSLVGAILIWGGGIAMVAAVSTGLLALSVLLQRRVPRFATAMPVISMLAMSASTFPMVFAVSRLSGSPFMLSEVLRVLPVNILIGVVIGAIFDFFVNAQINTKQRTRAMPDQPSERPHVITVAGTMISIGDIYMVSSQDHYLEIQLPDRKLLFRARLSDLLSQLSNEDGVLTHRSYWVSRDAIFEISGGPTSRVLILRDGQTVPIARTRLRDVRAWMNSNLLAG